MYKEIIATEFTTLSFTLLQFSGRAVGAQGGKGRGGGEGGTDVFNY